MNTRVRSIISLLLSIIAIVLSVMRCEPIILDWIGIFVGILSLLVTVLIGWNIYNVIDVKKTIEKQNAEIRKMEMSIKTLESSMTVKINELNSKMERSNATLTSYGYALTDFCQVYVKLEPSKKDYFGTYAKALSTIKNFLKTEEDINWYAPTCVENLKEALKLAKEMHEGCSNETELRIKEHLNEIRKCRNVEFNEYWEEILNIEQDRYCYLHPTTSGDTPTE